MRSSYILEPRSSSLAPNRSEGRTPFCISHRSQQRPGPPPQNDAVVVHLRTALFIPRAEQVRGPYTLLHKST